MTTFLVAAFLAVFAVLMVAVAITVRADRIRAYDAGLAELNDDIDRQRLQLDLRGAPGRLVDYRCAVNGHSNYWTPSGYRCGTCGVSTVSDHGWVDDAS